MCIRKTYIIKKSKQRMHVKGCSKLLAKIKQNRIQSLNKDNFLWYKRSLCISMKKFGTISAIWYNHSFVNRNKSAFLAIVLFEVMSKSNYGVWYVCLKCHAKVSYPCDSTLMITLGPPMMTTLVQIVYCIFNVLPIEINSQTVS